MNISRREISIILGLLQGLALYGLHWAYENDAWLTTLPLLYFPLWCLAISWPLLLLLCMETGNYPRALAAVSLFCGLLALLTIWTGWQASPHGEFAVRSLVVSTVSTLLVASFVALMFLQTFIWRNAPQDEIFFTYSWRNFLVVLLAGLFMLSVWLVLILWGSLFLFLEISFFRELFDKDWFRIPLLSMAFGLGVHIFRSLQRIIDSIAMMLEGLIRLLLPVVVLFIVTFMASLLVMAVFKGAVTLWAAGGSKVLISSTAFALFFVNAVYQAGKNRPYPLLMHRGLYAAIALLPVLPALSLYGLGTRIAQYGWTVPRSWAVLITLLLSLFALSYAWLVLRRRDAWTEGLSRVNKVMAVLVLGTLMLTNSPLLDFHALAAWSLFERLEMSKVTSHAPATESQFGQPQTGQMKLDDFNYNYVRRSLARPGYMRTQELLEQLDKSDAPAAERLRELVSRGGRPAFDASYFDHITLRPDQFEIPQGLGSFFWNRENSPPYLLVRARLGDSVDFHYVALWIHAPGKQRYHRLVAECAHQWEGRWRACGGDRFKAGEITLPLEELGTGEIEAVLPKQPFKNLRIGRWVFEF